MAAESDRALGAPVPVSQSGSEEWWAVWIGNMIVRRCYAIIRLVSENWRSYTGLKRPSWDLEREHWNQYFAQPVRDTPCTASRTCARTWMSLCWVLTASGRPQNGIRSPPLHKLRKSKRRTALRSRTGPPAVSTSGETRSASRVAQVSVSQTRSVSQMLTYLYFWIIIS